MDALTPPHGEGRKENIGIKGGSAVGNQAIPLDNICCLTHCSCCAQSTAQMSLTQAAAHGARLEHMKNEMRGRAPRWSQEQSPFSSSPSADIANTAL